METKQFTDPIEISLEASNYLINSYPRFKRLDWTKLSDAVPTELLGIMDLMVFPAIIAISSGYSNERNIVDEPSLIRPFLSTYSLVFSKDGVIDGVALLSGSGNIFLIRPESELDNKLEEVLSCKVSVEDYLKDFDDSNLIPSEFGEMNSSLDFIHDSILGSSSEIQFLPMSDFGEEVSPAIGIAQLIRIVPEKGMSISLNHYTEDQVKSDLARDLLNTSSMTIFDSGNKPCGMLWISYSHGFFLLYKEGSKLDKEMDSIREEVLSESKKIVDMVATHPLNS